MRIQWIRWACNFLYLYFAILWPIKSKYIYRFLPRSWLCLDEKITKKILSLKMHRSCSAILAGFLIFKKYIFGKAIVADFFLNQFRWRWCNTCRTFLISNTQGIHNGGETTKMDFFSLEMYSRGIKFAALFFFVNLCMYVEL